MRLPHKIATMIYSDKGKDGIYDSYTFYETPKSLLDRILSKMEPEFIKAQNKIDDSI